MKKLIFIIALCVTLFAKAQTPTNVNCTANPNGSITLSWQGCMAENSQGYTYFIHANDSKFTSTPSDYVYVYVARSVTITGLPANTKYYFKVRPKGGKIM